MIGADEFNVRKPHQGSQVTGDTEDAKYIKTFITNGNDLREQPGYLIDIIRPQQRLLGRRKQAGGSTSNSQTEKQNRRI